MHKLLIVSGLLFAASGCKNSNYCAGNPDNNCNEHPADGKQVDGMEALDCNVMGCGDSGKVCDTTTHACVECTTTESAACTGTSPVCKNDACTACVANADCPSHTCEPSGACAATSDVAWVALGGTGDCLTEATPCGSITTARETGRTTLHVTGHIAEGVAVGPAGSLVIVGDRDAMGNAISGLAYGAGTLVSLSGTASITLVDMELDGGSTATSGLASTSTGTIELDHVSIHNVTGVGVYSSGGTLLMDRVNVAHNGSGGISLASTMFHIKNAFVTDNGPTGTFGGILISQGSGSVEFATVANNLGINDGNSRGISCISTTTTIDSTLLQGNVGAQWGGTGCTYAYSNFYPDATPAPGTGNVRMQVTFAAANDYHLATGSPMKDIANPASTVGDDIDGNSRPQGAIRDIGADELMP